LGHRDRARPVGLGIKGTYIDDPPPEIKISPLKREQLVPAQACISGDNDDRA